MRDSFADHFSSIAPEYATYRPRYPAALFAYLAGLAPRRELAWDCAAGSGQATLDLAPYFRRVIATDASAAQLAAAPAHAQVEYRVAPAEASGLDAASIDLVIVAQALHWLDLDRFYTEVRRVLAPGGVLAVWCYAILRIEPAAIDDAIRRFYSNVVGPYWPPARRLVENGYRMLAFPFDELPAPAFEMVADWTLPQLLGYLGTWSATIRYREAQGHDPVEPLTAELAAQWGRSQRSRRITWPLLLRVGRASHARGVV
jgi:SAM-dependent methyltransferase